MTGVNAAAFPIFVILLISSVYFIYDIILLFLLKFIITYQNVKKPHIWYNE